jgi:magnesium chelatase subunit D
MPFRASIRGFTAIFRQFLIWTSPGSGPRSIAESPYFAGLNSLQTLHWETGPKAGFSRFDLCNRFLFDAGDGSGISLLFWQQPELVMKRYQYPFSAIVEQAALKTALLLNAVDPSIGGVLIRGHKGTGKSTAARALAQLLPPIEVFKDCPFNSDPRDPMNPADLAFAGARQEPRQTALRPMPFVELPLNATEDRLVGSLHIEKALQTGERRFEPGLLATANRGILYVDEVNLLADHLVDMLLDAASSGVNVIEREGISFVHPARFILIGTMNPEEGELRPQFLDRFGLSVAVESVVDLTCRKSIVQRHMAFERSPESFLNEWASADQTVADQIRYARKHLEKVGTPDGLMTTIVGLTRELQLQGHRADITILKAARAHAALMEKDNIDTRDLFECALMAIQHRMKPALLDTPEALRQKVRNTLRQLLRLDQSMEEETRRPEGTSLEDLAESMQVPGSAAAGSVLFSFLGKKHQETVFEPDRRIAATGIDVEDLLAKGEHGKRKARTAIGTRSGRYRSAEPIKRGERDYRIAVGATLHQAAMRSARDGIEPVGSVAVKQEDFRKKQLSKPCDNLIVFVVDCSGSMGSGAQARMKAAKGAALAILRRAHQTRSEVAMIAFGGQNATLVLPPTSSVAVAKSALEHLPSGGGTPFADGLLQAWQLIRRERLKDGNLRPILVIISDGDANVPISAGAEPLEEVKILAEKIARDRIAAVFIDAAAGQKEGSEMERIASTMRASYVAIGGLSAPSVLKAVLSRGELHGEAQQ